MTPDISSQWNRSVPRSTRSDVEDSTGPGPDGIPGTFDDEHINDGWVDEQPG